MHELSYITRMVSAALSAANENNIKRVDSMEIAVGEMTGLVPEYLERYYPAATEGSILEGSKLIIDFLPVKAECTDCGKVFAPSKENAYKCPVCGSPRAKVLSGREFDLVRLSGE